MPLDWKYLQENLWTDLGRKLACYFPTAVTEWRRSEDDISSLLGRNWCFMHNLGKFKTEVLLILQIFGH